MLRSRMVFSGIIESFLDLNSWNLEISKGERFRELKLFT